MLADLAPGDPLVDLHQVHGGDVVVVRGFDDVPTEPPDADAAVTDHAGITLHVRAADCVPLLLVADEGRVIGAAHCGRPGLTAGVVPATVAAMRALGAERVEAWIGPHVCGRCYEVPDTMRDEVAAAVPASRAVTSWGTPALDIGAGVRAQLLADDVEVTEVGACTRESPDLHSYRRDGGEAGRLAGLVRIRPWDGAA